MSALTTALSIALPILCLSIAVFVGCRAMNRNKNARTAFKKHFITLGVSLCLCLCGVMFVSAADTADNDAAKATSSVSASSDSSTNAATTAEKADNTSNNGAGVAVGLGFIGAGLSIGLAGVGAGIALASGAPAAIGAVAEDPKAFGKSIIFVALGEAVAIYGFIIAFLIVLRLPSGIVL